MYGPVFESPPLSASPFSGLAPLELVKTPRLCSEEPFVLGVPPNLAFIDLSKPVDIAN